LQFLKAPITNSNDLFTRSKFELTWYTFVVYFFITFILCFVHIDNNSQNFLISIVGVFYTTLGLLYLYFKREHVLVAKVTAIVCTIVIQYAVYTLINPDRTVDAIWFFIFSLFAFYTINVTWGIVILLINFLGLAFYQPILEYFLGITEYSIPISQALITDRVDYYMNFGFGVLFIAFLLVKLINEHKSINKELLIKNQLVNEQNNEKTVMLKEIHHRVKNNLQIISSLLRLQSRDIDDPKTIEQFEEATNRVVAMSLIHDKIYQSKNLSKIDFKEYLESLTKDLIKSYAINTPISVDIETEIELITPKFLVSFALIFNELITNTLKHAFKTSENGSISIIVIKKNNTLVIKYYDNGVWINEMKSTSFGIELIDTLTEQLDGEYQRDTISGTMYIFKIPFNSKNIN